MEKDRNWGMQGPYWWGFIQAVSSTMDSNSDILHGWYDIGWN